MLAGESEAIIAVILCITFFETEIFEVKFGWEEIRLHVCYYVSSRRPVALAHHQIYKTKNCFGIRPEQLAVVAILSGKPNECFLC